MADNIRAVVVSRRRSLRSYRRAAVIAAGVATGAYFASPATGESPVAGPSLTPAKAATGHGDILTERIDGDVAPTPTEVLILRWILRSHETTLSRQAITTEALLLRWLITKNSTTLLTSTSAPVAKPAPPPPPPPPPKPTPAPVATPAVTTSSASGYGCAAAVAYLDTHAAPGFTVVCPGYADGHYAMTCDDLPGVCPGQKVIVIAVPCPVAYMNEASNSLVLSGMSDAPIDPYGEDCQ